MAGAGVARAAGLGDMWGERGGRQGEQPGGVPGQPVGVGGRTDGREITCEHRIPATRSFPLGVRLG